MADNTGRVQHIVIRGAALAIFWWALVGGSPSSWYVGVPVVAAAVGLGMLIKAPLPSVSFFFGIFGFLPFFLLLSVRGGIDVARRALSVSLPLAPGCIEYAARLPGESALVFFANCISLLPGTLSVDLSPGRILVHTLDRHKPVARELAELERRVARLFGLTMQGGNDD